MTAARLARSLVLLCPLALRAVIIDRIAVVIGQHIIKDSDIVRDIRITAFLNREAPDFGPASRKRSASRLIDQQFIRDEIRLGAYPSAPVADAERLLDEIRSARAASDALWTRALSSVHITEDELRSALLWQLTVLRFVDLKFRPGVFIPEAQLQSYYDAHLQEIRGSHPGVTPSFEAFRGEIEEALVGQRVNELFYAWLDEKRKAASIEYREASLE